MTMQDAAPTRGLAFQMTEIQTTVLNLKTELYSLAMEDEHCSPHMRRQILLALRRAGLFDVNDAQLKDLVLRHPNFQNPTMIGGGQSDD